MTVTSPIAIGAVRGAQIVACAITLEDRHRFKACAKIYDPLYYNFQDGRCPVDCVREADDDYIGETWAYNFLEQKTNQAGSFCPKYHGSWTFTLPITLKAKGISIQRPVRLILLEHLEGASIQGSRAQNNAARGSLTDSFHYPEEYRLEVLTRAMDGYVRLKQAGIEQADFAGRNIVLVINIDEPGIQLELEKICGLIVLRIVLVDYNHAYMREQLSSDELETRPVNPALEFWGKYLFRDIAGWVPGSWSDIKIQQQWLLSRFCQCNRQEYRPVHQWMLDHLAQLQPQSSAENQGRTNTTAAYAHVPPAASSTRTFISQRSPPGNETTSTTITTTDDQAAQHPHGAENSQRSAFDGPSNSAENGSRRRSPPKTRGKLDSAFWSPNVEAFARQPPLFKDGNLFQI